MEVKNPKNSKSVLLIIFAVVLFQFLIMGLQLGTLPEFVHSQLKFSNLIVGTLIGIQYLSTLLTRHLAGKTADHQGGDSALKKGLVLTAVACILCWFSVHFSIYREISLIALFLGRILLGVGESFLVIGIFAWAFILVGSNNTGKVMVWNGLGMHAGLAAGAPLGIFLSNFIGLNSTFLLILVLPLTGFIISRLLPKVSVPVIDERLPFYKAVGMVWKSGTGLALASVAFSSIASFITLYFAQNNWENASFALTGFGAGYIMMRLFFAHTPDKYGGINVAIICLFLEIIGQFILWNASQGYLAILGSVITGCGMSLVFPSFGKIAIQNILPANRGMAMAAYNAFFDLGMGLTGPIAGLIASNGDYATIYLFGLEAAIVSLVLAFSEYRKAKTVLLK